MSKQNNRNGSSTTHTTHVHKTIYKCFALVRKRLIGDEFYPIYRLVFEFPLGKIYYFKKKNYFEGCWCTKF